MTAAVLREVRLYGPLRARFGRSHWLAVQSPAEAVRALCVLFKGFREALLGHQGPGYRVLVGEGPQTDARSDETLLVSAAPSRVIRIAPVIHGNKRGWGQVILGAIVTIVGIYTASYDGGATMKLGIGLMLGGAVALLSPQRMRNGSDAQKETSYVFSGAVNVASPGAAVPLLIGRVITGSVVASSGISTDDLAVATITNPADPALPPEQPEDPYDLNVAP